MIFLITLLLAGGTPSIHKNNTDISFGFMYPWGATTQITYRWTPDMGTSLITQAYKEYSSKPSEASSIELIQFYGKSFGKVLFCEAGSGIGGYLLTEDGKNSLEFGVPIFLKAGFRADKNTGIYVKFPCYYLFRDSEFKFSSTVTAGFYKLY